MRDAGEVLQRDPLRALGNEVGVAFRGRRVAEQQRAEPAGPHAEQVTGQEFGVHRGPGTPAAASTAAASRTASARPIPASEVMKKPVMTAPASGYSPMASRRDCSFEGLRMERSFKKEVEALKLGDGETFHGEGILAVTKALLQSGVSYVGGYQGAPISHLIDVLVDAEDIMDELGVHLETARTRRRPPPCWPHRSIIRSAAR